MSSFQNHEIIPDVVDVAPGSLIQVNQYSFIVIMVLKVMLLESFLSGIS